MCIRSFFFFLNSSSKGEKEKEGIGETLTETFFKEKEINMVVARKESSDFIKVYVGGCKRSNQEENIN